MNCPVCGKGKYQLLDGIDGPIENPTQPVSHLACVEHIAEDFDKLQREKKHAEAELAALKAVSKTRNDELYDRWVVEVTKREKAEAELAAPAGGWIDQLRTRAEQDEAEVTATHDYAQGELERANQAEAEVATWKSYAASVDEALKNVNESAQELEAELAALKAESERMRKGLRLIIERNPGQAHRIAIQILDPARAEEGSES